MKWIVDGADKSSGDTVRRLLEADSASAARQKAVDSGIYVSDVTPADGLKKHFIDAVPQYTPLVICSLMMRVLAVLVIAAGVLLMVAALFHLSEEFAFGQGIELGISGIFMFAISAACEALRDIARNSFKIASRANEDVGK